VLLGFGQRLALNHGLEIYQLIVENLPGQVQKGKELRIHHPVQGVRPGAAGLHQVPGPEDGQLLGDRRAFESQPRLQVPDRGLPLPQDLQDLDAGGVGQGFEELGLEAMNRLVQLCSLPLGAF